MAGFNPAIQGNILNFQQFRPLDGRLKGGHDVIGAIPSQLDAH